ncbi:MAG: hypothetical protein QOE36_3252 [Gaiellaceae bacterium]|jgi:hypothetical protein|nr:hypothetical protein [Gaiellaceae bacterium]
MMTSRRSRRPAISAGCASLALLRRQARETGVQTEEG